MPTLDHAGGIVADRRGARFFVTGWYDNHVYAIGAASDGAFLATPQDRARTRARRAFHAANPVE